MQAAHARERIAERLGVRLPIATQEAIAHKASTVAAASRGRSIAYAVHRLGYQAGTPWGESSNGDVVVAIIRDRRVVTYMLRRSSQPHEPGCYGVDEVM
jgi:hypothetical protein